MSSCKKEEPFNPDEHIVYEHWYKLSGSADTLYSVYFENTFTPNGDGINDDFRPVGYFSLIKFRVYNKSGEVIYETTDISKSWRGKVNNSGDAVQMGAYAYQFIVSDVYGESYDYFGTVMLYK